MTQPPDTRAEIISLAEEASFLLGVPRNDAIAYALRLVINMNPPSGSDECGSEKLLSSASKLMESLGSFTMDDLLDEIYGDAPVFSPHKVKIFAAKLLTASGYTRRQFRRGTRRPLLWYKHNLDEA